MNPGDGGGVSGGGMEQRWAKKIVIFTKEETKLRKPVY